MSKTAIITGITGQDGAYLAKLLLEKGYTVYGVCRSQEPSKLTRLERLGIQQHENLKLVDADLLDSKNVERLIRDISQTYKIDEIYNLAAESSVPNFSKNPEVSYQTNAMMPLFWLNAIKAVDSKIKFFQASSAEIFGDAVSSPQNEKTPLNPRNHYGNSKMMVHNAVALYRKEQNLFASNGVLFNHESPLRDERFVTQKIIHGVVKIAAGEQEFLELGNINVKRDWGHAEEYVKAMHLMLQQNAADDYVIATNQTATVKQFIQKAFQLTGIELAFENEGTLQEIARDKKTGKVVVKINPEFYREEKSVLSGDASKIKSQCGWEATKNWEKVCEEMFDAALLNKQKSQEKKQVPLFTASSVKNIMLAPPVAVPANSEVPAVKISQDVNNEQHKL